MTAAVDKQTLEKLYEQFTSQQPTQQEQATHTFPQGDTMDQLFWEWGRSKIQSRDLANHALANLQYVDKAAVAKARGLSEYERNRVTPFPVPQNINIEKGGDSVSEKILEKLSEKLDKATDNGQSPAPANTTSSQSTPLWQKLLLAGTAGTALTLPLGAAWWLTSGDKQGDTNTTIVQPVGEGEVDMRIERWKEVEQ